MKIEINIDRRIGLYIIFTMVTLFLVSYAVAYGGSDPSFVGHTWGEMECSGCIDTSDIADGAVTNDKVSSIDWSKITTGMPPGFADGIDNVMSCRVCIQCSCIDGCDFSPVASNWVCTPYGGGTSPFTTNTFSGWGHNCDNVRIRFECQ